MNYIDMLSDMAFSSYFSYFFQVDTLTLMRVDTKERNRDNHFPIDIRHQLVWEVNFCTLGIFPMTLLALPRIQFRCEMTARYALVDLRDFRSENFE